MAYTARQLETETHINWDRTGEDARLETFDPAMARKWARAGVGLTECRGRWTGRVPAKLIAIRRPVVLSEARRTRLRDQLQNRAGKVWNHEQLLGSEDQGEGGRYSPSGVGGQIVQPPVYSASEMLP